MAGNDTQSPLRAQTRAKARKDVEHVLGCIGLDPETIDHLIMSAGMKRMDIIEAMSDENLVKIQAKSLGELSIGDLVLLKKF